jgi:trigger factor
MVAAQYGYQIETEVLNDKVGRAFNDAANEANCALLATQHRTEGRRRRADLRRHLRSLPGSRDRRPDHRNRNRESRSHDAEIDKTIDILRKQRVHFHTKGEAGEHGDGGERSLPTATA